MKYSLILPAYRTLGYIPDNIKRIYESGKDVEFVVSADLLGEEDKKTLRALARKYPVVLDLSDKRRGKVNGVNDGIKKATGDVLVFVDSDTEVVPNLLEKVEDALKRGDFGGGVIKTRGENLLERMVRIDYLFINATLRIQEILGVSSGLNGAFIFARREVVEKLNGFAREIVEDVDFGVRATDAGFRPVFIPEHCATTSVPSTVREWFNQKKRWAIGGAVMAFRHWRFFLKHLPATLVQLFTLMPFLFLAVLFSLLPDSIFLKFAGLLAAVSSLVVPASLPLLYSGFMVLLTRYFALVLAGFVLFYVLTIVFRRMFGFDDVSLLDPVVYYFVYAPAWGLLATGAFVYVILRGGKVSKVPGWKV